MPLNAEDSFYLSTVRSVIFKNLAPQSVNHSDISRLTVCIADASNEAELIKQALLGHELKCELDGEHQVGFLARLELKWSFARRMPRTLVR